MSSGTVRYSYHQDLGSRMVRYVELTHPTDRGFVLKSLKGESIQDVGIIEWN